MQLEELQTAREQAKAGALKNILGFNLDIFYNSDDLSEEQRETVSGPNQAFEILKRQGRLEGFVDELVNEMMPDSLAVLPSCSKPVAIITLGALGADNQLFKNLISGNQVNDEAGEIIEADGLFIDSFDVFYTRLYAKLEAEGIGYSLKEKGVNLPGVRALSGIAVSVRDQIEKLGCSYIARDNFDALEPIKLTHKLQIIGYALSPEESLSMSTGCIFSNEQIANSARGFASYFHVNRNIFDDVILLDKDDKVIFRKVAGEVHLMDERYQSWLDDCEVGLPSPGIQSPQAASNHSGLVSKGQ